MSTDNHIWRVVPCDNPPGWWTVGYDHVTGPFVPVHHWASDWCAEFHADLLNNGVEREEALAQTRANAQPPAHVSEA